MYVLRYTAVLTRLQDAATVHLICANTYKRDDN